MLPYHDAFLPKTKMVHVVHMNIFYRMDLEKCDSKSEFWTNTGNLDFRKTQSKIQFWGPTLTFDANSKTEMMSKYILAYS